MAQAAVLEAFGNDLILERIFQPYDFKRLKELRLVCKRWNAFACHQLLRLCKNIPLRKLEQWEAYDECTKARQFSSSGLEKLKDVDPVCNHRNWILFGKLCDCRKSKVRSSVQQQQHAHEDPSLAQLASPEIFLKIPIDLEIRLEDTRLWNRLAGEKWRSQVVSLTISHWLKVAEVNRLTLFLLHHLPGLNKLKYCQIENQTTLRKDFDCQVPLLGINRDTEFGLERVHYGIVEGGLEAQVLDPSFLLHCPALKTLKIECQLHSNPKLGNNICFNFFNLWNQMALAKPGAFPPIRHLKFKLWSQFRSKAGTYAHLYDSIIDLINLNEPTRLDLLGNFNYNYPSFFNKIASWTRGIQALNIDVSAISSSGNSNFDEIFSFLKKFAIFAQLTHVTVRHSAYSAWGKLQLVDSQSQHELSKVVSVSLDFQTQNVDSLYVAAIQLPCLTHLNLKLPAGNYYTRYKYMDELFQACKNFTVLRLLSLEGDKGKQGQGIRFKNFQTSWNLKFKGAFKSLQVIKSLKTFKLVVDCSEAEPEPQHVLVALFKGYDPHVSLDLEVRTIKYTNCWGQYQNIAKSQKLVLSVEGFKEALKEALQNEQNLTAMY